MVPYQNEYCFFYRTTDAFFINKHINNLPYFLRYVIVFFSSFFRAFFVPRLFFMMCFL